MPGLLGDPCSWGDSVAAGHQVNQLAATDIDDLGGPLLALGGGVWLAASYSACWDGNPFDAVAADDATPIVVLVGEPMGAAAGLLGEHVNVLDPPVRSSGGDVVGEDLTVPAVDGSGQPFELMDVCFGAVLKNVIKKRFAWAVSTAA
jgi:hypothetical protein